MEAQQIQDQVNARLELRAEHGHGRKTHSTGSPRPGKLVDWLADRFPRRGGCGDKTGPPAEGGIQKLDVLRACPLLRAVHGCGTPRTGQGVVDVARHDEPSLGQPGVQAGQVNPGQSGQRPPPRGSSSPAESSSRPPNACTIPAPPSVLALPPMPSTIV